MQHNTTTGRAYLGGGDAAGGRGLTREEAVEVVSRLQHGPVTRDVGLRAEHVEGLFVLEV